MIVSDFCVSCSSAVRYDRLRFCRKLATSDDTSILIDLSRVAFFGVAGLHALFEARALAEDADIRVRVVTGPPCVTRLLDISRRLAHAPEPGFEVVHSLADALLETR